MTQIVFQHCRGFFKCLLEFSFSVKTLPLHCSTKIVSKLFFIEKMAKKTYDHLFKLLVVGDSAVGKSSMVQR